jgi:hypothetical protein
MSVKEADQLFTKLASRVFRDRDDWTTGLLGPLVSYSQGRFRAADIDECLFEIFGSMTMLKHPYMTSVGARIGFPVAEADTSQTRLITSYNGAAQYHSDAGCMGKVSTVLRSRNADDDILVRDA